MKTRMIVLFAHWCPKCNMMMPIVDEIEEEFGKEIDVCRIDVEEKPNMMQMYAAEIVPTFVILQDEKEIGRMSGLIGEEIFKARISSVLKEIQ